jgi:hypothetical protein
MSERRPPANIVEHWLAAPSPVTYRVFAVVLLAVIAVELFMSTRQESQVFDEATHLFAGFEYWKHADFGRNPEHPPLVKLIAAAPLLLLHLKEPGVLPFPYFKGQDFVNGSQFLYSADADSILMRGRMMVALFTIGLALLVLCSAREMFDAQTALLALGLLTFEPVLLANGALVTTDMGLTCLFFASVYAFYRYVKQPSIARLALCATATAFTLGVKHSGALILPTLALLALAEVLQSRGGPALDGTSSADSVARQGANLTAALVVVAVVSYFFLWAIYGFRYAARPDALQITPGLREYTATLQSSTEKALISFFARHHLFPEAYLYGWVDILQLPGFRPTFLFGKIYGTGRWFFFPAVFLIKTTLTLLVLLALVPFAGLWRRRRELLFLATPAAFLLLVSMLSGLNLGVRHILPIYPFCIVLAAAAGWYFAARSLLAAFGVAALLLFVAASSLHSYPDYLAYSNEAFGGPSSTYRVVTDSNADWGQGLKWVKRYLDGHHISDCWFDYGVPIVNPHYYGIDCKPLLSALARFGFGQVPVPSSISGTILISATELEGLLWGPDALNPYEVFKSRRPDAVIGNTVLVYRGTFDVPLLAAYSRAAGAIALLYQRRLPEAITEAQTAVKEGPDSAEIHATLGRILMTAGRTAEGQQELTTALHLAHTIHPDYQANLIRQIEQTPH